MKYVYRFNFDLVSTMQCMYNNLYYLSTYILILTTDTAFHIYLLPQLFVL